MSPVNPERGEAMLMVAGAPLVLRPSFAALVAAEAEVGPLFALVERAADGRLALGEMVALFWHCLAARPEGLTRAAFGEAVAAGGLAAATPALKTVIGQILAGRGVSDDFAGCAARLAGLMGVVFGWTPDIFWAATPADAAALVGVLAGEGEGVGSGELARLMEAFPDG